MKLMWCLVACMAVVLSFGVAYANDEDDGSDDPLTILAWYRLQHSVGNTSHDVPDHASAIDATLQPNESWNARCWVDPSNGDVNELHATLFLGNQTLKFGRAYMPLSYLGYPRDQLFIEDTLAEKLIPVFDTGIHYQNESGLSFGVVNGTGIRSDDNSSKDVYFRCALPMSDCASVSVGTIWGKQPDGLRFTNFFGIEWKEDEWYGKAELFEFNSETWASPWSWYGQLERSVNSHWRLGVRYEHAKLEPSVYSRKEITSIGVSRLLNEWSRLQLMYFTDRTVNGGKNEEGVHFAFQIHF